MCVASEDQGQDLHVPSCPKANSHFRAKRKGKSHSLWKLYCKLTHKMSYASRAQPLLQNKNKSTDFPLKGVLAHVCTKHPTLRLNRALSDTEERVWCGPSSLSQFSPTFQNIIRFYSFLAL